MLQLMNADSDAGVVLEGRSCNITGTLKDNGNTIEKAAVQTLTLTLYDEETAAVINSRNSQNIKDANGCSLSDESLMTIELDADDNVVVDTNKVAGDREKHVARVTWTWNDGDSTRIGGEELWFWVEKLATPE